MSLTIVLDIKFRFLRIDLGTAHQVFAFNLTEAEALLAGKLVDKLHFDKFGVKLNAIWGV